MPRISKEESDARRTEIIDACESLYRSESYRDITMAQIAERVSFGRANVYNYFQCKDEILLALLQREHDVWAADLAELGSACAAADDERIAEGIASSVARREPMLKLLAMSLSDMERGSRFENLVEFKRSYARAIGALRGVLAVGKPNWTTERSNRFVFGFMPFLHGVYPYAFHSEKQLAAMKAAGISHGDLDVYETVRSVALKMLQEDDV